MASGRMSEEFTWPDGENIDQVYYEYLEKYIRAKIAEEIEAEGPWCSNHNNPGQPNDCPCYVFAAKIARGTND